MSGGPVIRTTPHETGTGTPVAPDTPVVNAPDVTAPIPGADTPAGINQAIDGPIENTGVSFSDEPVAGDGPINGDGPVNADARGDGEAPIVTEEPPANDPPVVHDDQPAATAPRTDVDDSPDIAPSDEPEPQPVRDTDADAVPVAVDEPDIDAPPLADPDAYTTRRDAADAHEQGNITQSVPLRRLDSNGELPRMTAREASRGRVGNERDPEVGQTRMTESRRMEVERELRNRINAAKRRGEEPAPADVLAYSIMKRERANPGSVPGAVIRGNHVLQDPSTGSVVEVRPGGVEIMNTRAAVDDRAAIARAVDDIIEQFTPEQLLTMSPESLGTRIYNDVYHTPVDPKPTTLTPDQYSAQLSGQGLFIDGWFKRYGGDFHAGQIREPKGDVRRVYMNLQPDQAMDFSTKLLAALDRAGIAEYQFKMPQRITGFDRPDAGVLYVNDADLPLVQNITRLAAADQPSALAAGTPRFTERLAPGVALAQEPIHGLVPNIQIGRSGGVSFGSAQAALFAEAIKAAPPGISREGLIELVRATYAKYGADPDQPWLAQDPAAAQVEPGTRGDR